MTVGEPVQAIGGLQPFRQAHKHGRQRLPHRGNRGGLGLVGGDAPAPSPNIANAPPYLVSEVLKAYNADGLDVDGAGTIAILIDTFPADADMQGFWRQNNPQITSPATPQSSPSSSRPTAFSPPARTS
jgi:kumamolisin